MTLALVDVDRGWVDSAGYLRTGRDKFVHRLVVEQSIKRKLKPSEIVHHVDYNKQNNSPDNLVLCPNSSYHKLLHARQDVFNDGYHPDLHHYCTGHKRYEFKEAFSFRNTWCGLHNMCRDATNEYRKLKEYVSIFNWRRRLNQQYRRIKNKEEVCSLPKEGRCL